jgi:hypothetical protein
VDGIRLAETSVQGWVLVNTISLHSIGGKLKVKVKLSMCLTKHHTMKA